MAYKHGSTWTERTGHSAGPDADDIEPGFARQGFQKHHSSMGAVHVHHDAGLGAAGRVLHMIGVFVPMLAGELVQDATKYKKTVRLASIGTAVGYEVLHVIKEQQRQNAMQAKLDECRGRE
jgi:hypothetical protein